MVRILTLLSRRGARAALLPYLALIACAGGCGHKVSTEPGALESSSLSRQVLGPDERTARDDMGLGWPRHVYPLAIGNSWDYVFRTSYTQVTNGQAAPPAVSLLLVHDEVVGVQHRGTRDYFVIEDSLSWGGVPFGTFYVLFRQDSDGLFIVYPPNYIEPDTRAASHALADEISPAVNRVLTTAGHREAFQRAALKAVTKLVLARRGAVGPDQAATTDAGELKILGFPLYVGAHWTESESPRVERMVTAHERVRVPAGTTPAWRVRMRSPALAEEDRYEEWYSAAGLVRYHSRIESDVVDDQGTVLGTLVYEADQSLTALHIGDPGRAR
jgi:hypothetical protein